MANRVLSFPGSGHFGFWGLPIVSIAAPFLGLPCGSLSIEVAIPKKGTTVETIGRVIRIPGSGLHWRSRVSVFGAFEGFGFRPYFEG